jgi:hypothetical protein
MDALRRETAMPSWALSSSQGHRLMKIFSAVVAAAVFAVMFVSARSTTVQAQETKQAPLRWYKGNTHVHTVLCGHADSTPAAVTQWYHDRGYNFLCLSEHNQYIDPATVEMPKNKREDFILIPGQEVTGEYIIHTTALNTKSLVDWRQKFAQKSQVIQNHVDGTHGAQGVPILNHPNFRYALNAEDILPVKRLHLFELYNGHPSVNNRGDATHPSTERLWDTLLDAGMVIYGVSSDDAHEFKKWAPNASNPGRGWIMVRANSLTPDAITKAVHSGDFYASSGVILHEVSATNGRYRVVIDDKATKRELESPVLFGRTLSTEEIAGRKPGYYITFTGPGGKILHTARAKSAEYKFDAKTPYVRCKVSLIRKKGDALEEFAAWTQPAFSDGRVQSHTIK